MTLKINLKDVVGKGYGTFWNFKGRYRVVKGSRASKKSKTAALNDICRIMQYDQANLLVVRKTYRTLKDSVFADLKWAIHRLGVDDYWNCTLNPLEMTYMPTGQKIYFRGLDDPLKITSIAVERGYLCWMRIEEAYEIDKEEDFDILDESIRGETPGCFKQVTLTFNPWNDRHWLKHRFFDELTGRDKDGRPIYKERTNPISDDGQILAITTNYLCNEFLDSSDFELFERMKIQNPRRYQVAGLGNWGTTEGLVFSNFSEKVIMAEDVLNLKTAFGLDWGYSNDPTAFVEAYVDEENSKLYIKNEIYQTGLTNKMIADVLKERGYSKAYITADSSEPKSIDELRGYGISHVKGAKKGKGSIASGIQYIQNYEIIIDPKCENFITEINNYKWKKDKFGKTTDAPEDAYNHLIDALRYGMEKFQNKSNWLF